MKVKTWVQTEAEIDIDVDLLRLAFTTLWDIEDEDGWSVMQSIIGLHQILEAISDEQIASMKPEHRFAVFREFTKQANRFNQLGDI